MLFLLVILLCLVAQSTSSSFVIPQEKLRSEALQFSRCQTSRECSVSALLNRVLISEDGSQRRRALVRKANEARKRLLGCYQGRLKGLSINGSTSVHFSWDTSSSVNSFLTGTGLAKVCAFEERVKFDRLYEEVAQYPVSRFLYGEIVDQIRQGTDEEWKKAAGQLETHCNKLLQAKSWKQGRKRCLNVAQVLEKRLDAESERALWATSFRRKISEQKKRIKPKSGVWISKLFGKKLGSIKENWNSPKSFNNHKKRVRAWFRARRVLAVLAAIQCETDPCFLAVGKARESQLKVTQKLLKVLAGTKFEKLLEIQDISPSEVRAVSLAPLPVNRTVNRSLSLSSYDPDCRSSWSRSFQGQCRKRNIQSSTDIFARYFLEPAGANGTLARDVRALSERAFACRTLCAGYFAQLERGYSGLQNQERARYSRLQRLRLLCSTQKCKDTVEEEIRIVSESYLNVTRFRSLLDSRRRVDPGYSIMALVMTSVVMVFAGCVIIAAKYVWKSMSLHRVFFYVLLSTIMSGALILSFFALEFANLLGDGENVRAGFNILISTSSTLILLFLTSVWVRLLHSDGFLAASEGAGKRISIGFILVGGSIFIIGLVFSALAFSNSAFFYLSRLERMALRKLAIPLVLLATVQLVCSMLYMAYCTIAFFIFRKSLETWSQVSGSLRLHFSIAGVALACSLLKLVFNLLYSELFDTVAPLSAYVIWGILVPDLGLDLLCIVVALLWYRNHRAARQPSARESRTDHQVPLLAGEEVDSFVKVPEQYDI